MAEPERPRVISSNRFHDALVTAGVIRDGEHYRRIVIDAHEGRPVVIYAERFADERLLDIVMTLDGIEIRGQEREPA